MPKQSRIGPGRLVLVVGPSGAGKDTLIRAAREACLGDAAILFPRRVVTRTASGDEDHDTMSPLEFEKAVATGAFALSWTAHGLRYGVPATIDAELRAGRTVVCNVSRTVVSAARGRYARAVVVLVTAPHGVLGRRLAARNRAADGDLGARLDGRAAIDQCLAPDLVIQNVDSIEAGARKLMETFRPRPERPGSDVAC